MDLKSFLIGILSTVLVMVTLGAAIGAPGTIGKKPPATGHNNIPTITYDDGRTGKLIDGRIVTIDELHREHDDLLAAAAERRAERSRNIATCIQTCKEQCSVQVDAEITRMERSAAELEGVLNS